MGSKLTGTGYLMIDHRDSPGVTPEMAAQAGLPVGAASGLFEADILSCNHCQTQLLKNPDRVRPREYCAKCNKYICDRCAAIMSQTNECVPFAKLIDSLQEQAVKDLTLGSY